MDPQETFNIWAPEESIWSNWAKPVLFNSLVDETLDPLEGPFPGIANFPNAASKSACIIDIAGEEAITLSMSLAEKGYRPVPLFNSVEAPAQIVNVTGIVHSLGRAAGYLRTLKIPYNAPPVFLLDALRHGNSAMVSPGHFDNRSVVVPQDMPSARFLMQNGIQHLVLISYKVQDDLSHILFRYQEQGIDVSLFSMEDHGLKKITVGKPSKYKSLWYRILVLWGLKRNSTGGFGAVIPEPSASGGWG